MRLISAALIASLLGSIPLWAHHSSTRMKHFGLLTTPSAQQRSLRDFFLMSRPPLLTRWGMARHCTLSTNEIG